MACHHSHLNRDLARRLCLRTQIAILDRTFVPVATGQEEYLQIWDCVGTQQRRRILEVNGEPLPEEKKRELLSSLTL